MSQSNIPVATAVDVPKENESSGNSGNSFSTATVYPEIRVGNTSMLPTATIASLPPISENVPTSQSLSNNQTIPQSQYPIAIAEAYPYLQPQQNTWLYSVDMSEPIPESYYNLVLCQKLSKTIRFFSALDTLLCLFYVFVSPIISILCIFPVLGYFGAKNYQVKKLYAYSVFVIFLILGRAAMLSYHVSAWSVLLTALNWVVEFWILRLICNFTDIIKKLPREQIEGLRRLNHQN